MQDWPNYELIDFGNGRKLERFAECLFDRPCPAATELVPKQSSWQANCRYTGSKVGDGKWKPKPAAHQTDTDRSIAVPLNDELAFRMQVECSPAGQVGMFPEQFSNWRWIARQAGRLDRSLRVLNLFAYSGGSTLAAALGGAEVTHVDASKPSVALARHNAEISGLAEAPIRWIVEDVVKYCRRELKRGSHYDAVVLDPPSYGHGPKGEEWRIQRDLPTLLGILAELTERTPVFFLASCHTPGIGPAELSAYLSDAIVGHCGQPPSSGRLWLETSSGRRLESGVYARWPR